VESEWIIFFSTMSSQVPFGIHSLAVYGLAGVMSGRVVDLFACWKVSGVGLNLTQFGR